MRDLRVKYCDGKLIHITISSSETCSRGQWATPSIESSSTAQRSVYVPTSVLCSQGDSASSDPALRDQRGRLGGRARGT